MNNNHTVSAAFDPDDNVLEFGGFYVDLSLGKFLKISSVRWNLDDLRNLAIACGMTASEEDENSNVTVYEKPADSLAVILKTIALEFMV